LPGSTGQSRDMAPAPPIPWIIRLNRLMTTSPLVIARLDRAIQGHSPRSSHPLDYPVKPANDKSGEWTIRSSRMMTKLRSRPSDQACPEFVKGLKEAIEEKGGSSFKAGLSGGPLFKTYS
jgi:hypothetical protein